MRLNDEDITLGNIVEVVTRYEICAITDEGITMINMDNPDDIIICKPTCDEQQQFLQEAIEPEPASNNQSHTQQLFQNNSTY